MNVSLCFISVVSPMLTKLGTIWPLFLLYIPFLRVSSRLSKCMSRKMFIFLLASMLSRRCSVIYAKITILLDFRKWSQSCSRSFVCSPCRSVPYQPPCESSDTLKKYFHPHSFAAISESQGGYFVHDASHHVVQCLHEIKVNRMCRYLY